jgi:hypothetical protein
VRVKNRGHKHYEAFMLMIYECPNGHTERIWNSRDGVAPFKVPCRECNEFMTHIDWHRDRYLPNYKPKPGERIFVDCNKRQAKKIWGEWEPGLPCLKEVK